MLAVIENLTAACGIGLLQLSADYLGSLSIERTVVRHRAHVHSWQSHLITADFRSRLLTMHVHRRTVNGRRLSLRRSYCRLRWVG